MHIREPEVIFHPPPQEQPRCQGARTQRRGPQRGGAPPAGAPPRVSAPPASQPEPVVSLTLSAYSVECEAPLPDPPTQGHPALHSSSGLQSSYLASSPASFSCRAQRAKASCLGTDTSVAATLCSSQPGPRLRSSSCSFAVAAFSRFRNSGS